MTKKTENTENTKTYTLIRGVRNKGKTFKAGQRVPLTKEEVETYRNHKIIK